MLKLKDALVLTGITLMAGLLLGGAYEWTREPIAQQKIAANAAAYRAVFPDAEEFKSDETLGKKVERSDALLARSGMNLGNVTVDEAVYAYGENADFLGVVVKATSKDGYGGDIRIVAGVRDGEEKTVTGIDFLEINETAGLGMKATEAPFRDQFAGKSAAGFVLPGKTLSGGNSIEAISGATFTSNAVTNAVNGAVYFARESALKQ